MWADRFLNKKKERKNHHINFSFNFCFLKLYKKYYERIDMAGIFIFFFQSHTI